MTVAVPTRAAFDRYADEYPAVVDQAVGFTGKNLAFFTKAKAYHLLRLGQALARPLARCSALDVGCGIGALDHWLLPNVGSLHGVDVSNEMVARAAERNPGATYQVYGGERLPFGDCAFDLVFAVCVVHHVDPTQWDAFIGELWRVTRPGGAAVVIEHNPINPLTRRSVANCPFDDDAVLVGPCRLMGAFHAAGAVSVTRRYILFAPFGGSRTRAAEGLLGWLPLGAQHVVAACR